MDTTAFRYVCARACATLSLPRTTSPSPFHQPFAYLPLFRLSTMTTASPRRARPSVSPPPARPQARTTATWAISLEPLLLVWPSVSRGQTAWRATRSDSRHQQVLMRLTNTCSLGTHMLVHIQEVFVRNRLRASVLHVCMLRRRVQSERRLRREHEGEHRRAVAADDHAAGSGVASTGMPLA